MDDLLPCPFCGGAPQMTWGHMGCAIVCRQCNARSKRIPKCANRPALASTLWNKRFNAGSGTRGPTDDEAQAGASRETCPPAVGSTAGANPATGSTFLSRAAALAAMNHDALVLLALAKERECVELAEALRKVSDMAEALDEPSKVTDYARAVLAKVPA